MRAIATIIFDLDGTLVDSSRDILNSVNLALKEMGLPEVDMEQARKGIGPGSDVFAQTMLAPEQYHRWEELLERYRRCYVDHCTERSTLYPGVKELIGHLSNGSPSKPPYLAVATNKPHSMTDRILEHFGLFRRFRMIVGPEDVTHLKPDPEMVQIILETTGSSPGETLLVGDTDNDIRAGKDAHILTCGAAYGYFPKEHLLAQHPDFLIEAPLDLLTVLDGRLTPSA
ncbi:MAG: HAD-IA family hydrolase [Candidatus Latescibacterota bacterium]